MVSLVLPARWLAVLAAILLSIGLGASPAATAAGAEEGVRPTIRIGHSETGSRARDWGPVGEHLAQSDGFRYEIHGYDSAEKLYDAFAAGKVDAAIFGPINYVRARSELGATPIVADGPAYRSVVFVPKDSPVQTLAELRGKRMAFGYAESTTSYMLPVMMLKKAGVPLEALGSYEMTGGQQKAIDAVLAGRFDAGGGLKAIYDEYADRLRAIAVSEPIPGGPLAARKSLPSDVIEDLRALLRTFQPSSPDAYEAFARGAELVTDADYNEVRFLAKVVLGKDYR